MRFGLDEDQAAIHEMAAGFAAEHLAPHALDWDQHKTFPVATLRAAAALGMAGICVGEDVGGSGLRRVDAAVIFEALGQGCPTVAAFLSIHNLTAWIVDAFGSPELRARVLPDLTRMDRIASYCLTEAASGSDAAALRTRAVRDGDHYVLTGEKQFISGAGASDVYLVMARTGGPGPDGISAILVDRDTPGLSFGADERKMGWNAQPTRAVRFEGCRVPVENRVGAEGQGFRIAMAGLDGGRLNIAACSLGGAQGALDRSVAYLADRRAFGRVLVDFQALQFRLADMATSQAVSRAFLHHAAAALDARAPEATSLCAMAKRHVTDAAFAVANDALQLHGGYGYLHEYGIEKIVRDLRVHQILEGTNEIMRVIVARALIGGRR